VLEGRANGQIDDAIADFAEEFQFKDYGIGLEFQDKKGLAEFFRKTREFYPDSSIQIENIFVTGDHVIGEWTFQTTLAEPFFAGLRWKLPVSLRGASILRIQDGKIIDWADYYDGLTSRRTSLASYFTEWVEP
jgi:ketosteroid isomerase-like protein